MTADALSHSYSPGPGPGPGPGPDDLPVAAVDTEPYDTDYGSRDYRARDPDGNARLFGTYRPGVED
jgi:hypothetical protein